MKSFQKVWFCLKRTWIWRKLKSRNVWYRACGLLQRVRIVFSYHIDDSFLGLSKLTEKFNVVNLSYQKYFMKIFSMLPKLCWYLAPRPGFYRYIIEISWLRLYNFLDNNQITVLYIMKLIRWRPDHTKNLTIVI